MADNDTMMRAMAPGMLNGKAPVDHGVGRRCACGAKMGRYTTGDRCNLCHDNPARHQAAVESQPKEIKVFGSKWKSKQYPDGCIDCPEDEKFSRRHTGGGRCSKHYQRFLKDQKAQLAANIAAECAAAEDSARKLGGQPNGIVNALPDPRLDGRLEFGEATAGGGVIEVDVEGYPDPVRIPTWAETELVPLPEPNPADFSADDDGADAYRRAVNGEDEPEEAVERVRLMRIIDTGYEAPATEGEIAAGKATRTLELGEQIPWDIATPGARVEGQDECSDEPLPCCGAKESPVDDCGGPGCVHRERFRDDHPRNDLPEHLRGGLDLFEKAFTEHVDSAAKAAESLRDYHHYLRLAESAGNLANEIRGDLAMSGVDVSATLIVAEEDDEVSALSAVIAAVKHLEPAAVQRIVGNVYDRFVEQPRSAEAVAKVDDLTAKVKERVDSLVKGKGIFREVGGFVPRVTPRS